MAKRSGSCRLGALALAWFVLAPARASLAQRGPLPVRGGLVSSISAVATRPAEAGFRWTPEAMERARPLSLERPGAARRRGSLRALPGGPPGFLPATLPAGEREPETTAGSLAAGSPSAMIGFGYPPPYTRYENFPKITVFPYRTVGTLFFRQYGTPYRCTAASIGNYAIWTAGHCVHAGDGSPEGWSTDFLFVPAFQAGKKPKFGRFTGSFAVTTSEWYAASEFGRDMGGVVLQKAGTSRVSDRVGALGFAWNQPQESHWFVLGYPAEAPFDGSRQIVCAASFANADDTSSPSATGIGCDQTGGASGGPWILALSSGSSGNFLNGNVSYGYAGFPEELYSPYFDDTAKALRDCLVGSSPGSAAC